MENFENPFDNFNIDEFMKQTMPDGENGGMFLDDTILSEIKARFDYLEKMALKEHGVTL
jgi:hypothetical protein